MTPIAHLGTKVSALLDGQLADHEAERAWTHVHGCHACRDLVEREGWVKSQLSLLGGRPWGAEPPAGLVGALRDLPPGALLAGAGAAAVPTRRPAGLAALGGSALGVAVIGVLALGAAPASAPSLDRRAPLTQVSNPVTAPSWQSHVLVGQSPHRAGRREQR